LSNQNTSVQQPQNQLDVNQMIEMVNNSRDEIIRKQSDSNTASITAYDGLTRLLQSTLKQIQNQEKEIIRIQELCRKNNIDYAIPPPQVVAPQSSTQELTNLPEESVPKTTQD